MLQLIITIANAMPANKPNTVKVQNKTFFMTILKGQEINGKCCTLMQFNKSVDIINY
ncbi:MAG: hypothetical protein JWP44_3613 [Mucilaginibacter sp.]|nr:hypothetical protein [Mucilaginibacter sp.]